jgi:hypothetical protein
LGRGEVTAIERRVSFTVRVPENTARSFKAACALEGVRGQDVLEKAILEFIETKKEARITD